jgi:AcrR family transcriptional regulator
VADEKKKKSANTKAELLQAAHDVLIEHGFSGLSTRRVADLVGAPMSQIQYHFGSKESMILALFEGMNARLIVRQMALFEDSSLTVSEQWNKACDFLDEDMASGYVRILQELIAAGWSNPTIGKAVSKGLDGWTELLTEAAVRAERELGSFAPFAPSDIAALVSVAYLGAETQILLGREGETLPIRRALRRIGDMIQSLERAKEGCDARETS